MGGVKPKAEVADKVKAEVKVEPQVEAAAEVKSEPKVEQELQEQRPQRGKLKPLLSFSSLLAGELHQEQGQKESETETESYAEAILEENYAEKLEASRSSIMEYIASWRPRFVATFEAMNFEGEGISISVPSKELEEEILRTQTELLTNVAQIAGVKGKIELNIELNEAIKASRPIKLEDRVAHISKANPLVEELRKRFDLMVE